MANGTRHALCGLLLSAVFLAACSGGDGQLPYEEDFSEGCGNWNQHEDEDVELGCTDGQYRISFKSTANYSSHTSLLELDEPVSSLALEADVSVRAAPGGSQRDPAAIGLTCVANRPNDSDQKYVFYVAPHRQSVAIFKLDSANPRDTPLTEEFVPFEGAARMGGTSRMRAECRRVDDQVRLTLLLDGEQVAEATDPEGYDSYTGFGFAAASPKAASSDFRYDNLSVEELD